jgi:penicillin-binding protein 1A
LWQIRRIGAVPCCPRLRWRERAPAMRHLLLDLDARLDSGTYQCLARTVEFYRRYACWLERYRPFGWRRMAVGACSEGTSLLAGGLLLLLVLGLPTFQFTSTLDLLTKPQLSVVFLDRYGHEIGRRGIRRADPVPLDQYPSYLIQAVLATEDRRFYDHPGIDLLGTLRALTVDLTAQTTIWIGLIRK